MSYRRSPVGVVIAGLTSLSLTEPDRDFEKKPLTKEELEAAREEVGEFGNITVILAGCPKQRQPILNTHVRNGSFLPVADEDVFRHSIWCSKVFQRRGEFPLNILQRRSAATTQEWQDIIDGCGDGTRDGIPTEELTRATRAQVCKEFEKAHFDNSNVLVVASKHSTVNKWNDIIIKHLAAKVANNKIVTKDATGHPVEELEMHRMTGSNSGGAWHYIPSARLQLFVGMRVALTTRRGNRPKHSAFKVDTIGRDHIRLSRDQSGRTGRETFYLGRHKCVVRELSGEDFIFWQFPTIPAYAKTAMSVQGGTLKKLFWDVDETDIDKVAYGSTHVVGGRVCAAQDVILTGDNAEHITEIPSRANLHFIKGLPSKLGNIRYGNP